jgi:hypothetical protein
MKGVYLLIFLSFLLSLLLFYFYTKKKKLNFDKARLFAIVSVILLPFLWIILPAILGMSNCHYSSNPLLVFVIPVLFGFFIWSFIHLIKYKIFLGLIIPLLDILILILAFLSRDIIQYCVELV